MGRLKISKRPLLDQLVAAGRRTLNHGQLVRVCLLGPPNGEKKGLYGCPNPRQASRAALLDRPFATISPGQIEYFVCRRFVWPHNWRCLGKAKARGQKQLFSVLLLCLHLHSSILAPVSYYFSLSLKTMTTVFPIYNCDQCFFRENRNKLLIHLYFTF